MIHFVITMLIALIGGVIFKRIRIPAAGLVGGLVAVVALNLTTDICYFPKELKTILSLMIGIYVGSTIETNDLKSLKGMGLGCIAVVAAMVGSNMLLGLFVSKGSNIDLITSLLGTAPGGSQEMAILADQLNADVSLVIALQLARIFITYIVLTPMIKAISNRYQNNEKKYMRISTQEGTDNNKRQLSSWAAIILIAVAAIISGKIFDLFHLPGGSLTGALLSTMLLSFIGIRLRINKKISFYILVISGASIGSGIARTQIVQLYRTAFPILIMLAVMIVVNIMLALLMKRLCHVDIQTAMYSCAPGGLGDMVIMATEAGVNPAEVTAIHILRILSSVTIYPLVISVFL